jgi:DNA polymerase I-like protein with 3'-5' exonuclease and polymerase domains
MNVLAIDTESNTWNKGAPFDRRFTGVAHSWASKESSGAAKNDPDALAVFDERIRRSDVIVGFNLKYDCHVLRKLGITSWQGKRLWDCQQAEFIKSNQTWKYPSLNEASQKYGLGSKIDIIAEKYWKNGIQTDQIPWEELSEYAVQDAVLTLKLYEAQLSSMSSRQQKLVRLSCMDLEILEEMEWNGIRYDEELCDRRAEDIRNQIQEITTQLSGIYPDVPINFNSGDDLSAFLYGGTVKEEIRIHDGFYKTGIKAGQPKFRREERVHELQRLVNPLRGSELKKEGFFATNADTLLKLRGNRKTKHIIELIQRQTRLQTLLSKTYEGLRKANREQNWEPGYLHGQFNQVTVATGRLSSSNPNLQNTDSEANDLFISRYND